MHVIETVWTGFN